MADSGFFKRDGKWLLRSFSGTEFVLDDQWTAAWHAELSGKFHDLKMNVANEFRKLRIETGLKRNRKRG